MAVVPDDRGAREPENPYVGRESGSAPDAARRPDRPVARSATDRSGKIGGLTGTRPNPSLTARIRRYGHRYAAASLAIAELPS